MAKNETKAKIIKAAEQILAKHGYFGFSVRKVAKQAGIAPSVLYFHYKNKKAIIEQLMVVIVDRINTEFIRQTKGKNIKKQIEQLIFISLKHGISTASLFWQNSEKDMGNMVKDLAKDQKLRDKIIPQFYKIFMQNLVKAIKQKKIRNIDPKLLSEIITYTMKGYGIMNLFKEYREKEYKKFAKEFTNLLFQGLANK